MPFELRYNAEQHIMELQMRGDLTLELIREAAAALAPLAKETGCDRLLTDCRLARLRMSTLEIHEVPDALEEALSTLGVDLMRLQRALVAQADLEDFKFFETVALNRRQRLRLFTDIDEARRWLLGPAAESPP